MNMEPNRRDSWREKAVPQQRRRLQRDSRRIGIVLALSALFGVLLAFLLPPFFAPRTHLVVIGPGSGGSLSVPPIPFAAEDEKGMAAIADVEVHRAEAAFQSASNAKRLADVFTGATGRESDTLLIHLAAHGVSDDGVAYLLCDNFSLRRVDEGRVAVTDLLAQIRRSPAKTKVLLLNAGTIDYDPRMGMMVNDFPRLLDQAVRETGDPSLWVLSSHGPFQYSHSADAARRSAFSLFVSEGLRGAADVNQDRTVDLFELARFAKANVTRWVESMSVQAATQSPQLIWGGQGTPDDDAPRLVTLTPSGEPYRFEIANFLLPPDDPNSLVALAASGSPSTGVLTRRHLADDQGGSPDGGPDSGGDTESEGEGKAGEDPDADSPDGEATEPAGSDEKETGEPGASASGSSDAIAFGRARTLLNDAWKLRDQAEQEWAVTNPQASPLENVPHLWREFQAEMLSFERSLRSGESAAPEKIASVLQSAFPPPAEGEAKATSSNDPPSDLLWQPTGDRKVVDATALKPNQVHSLALARLYAQQTGATFEVSTDKLQSLLQQEDRKPFDEWIKQGWSDELNRFSETRFVRRLNETPNIDWQLLKQASRTRFVAERVAALDLVAPNWVRTKVETADRERCFAEALIFDQIGQDWRTNAIAMLQDAEKTYLAAEGDFETVRRAELVRDQVVDRVPAYLRLYRRNAGATDGAAHLAIKDIQTLLRNTASLAEQLDAPRSAKLATIDRLQKSLRVLIGQIESPTSDRAVQRLVAGAMTRGDSWRVATLLDSPILTATSRQRLAAAFPRLSREFASGFEATEFPPALHQASRPMTASKRDWDSLLTQANLEMLFVTLWPSAPSCGEASDNSSPACQAVQSAFQALTSLHQSRVASGQAGATAQNELWEAYARFGAALASFYRQESTTTAGQPWCAPSVSASLAHSLRMLDPRDAWRFRDVDVASLSVAHKLQSSLPWQAERLRLWSIYRSPSTATRLQDTAESYREAAAVACGQPFEPSPASPFSVSGPDSIDIQYVSSDQFAVTFKNHTDEAISLRLKLTYDERLVGVDRIDIDDESATQFNGAGHDPASPNPNKDDATHPDFVHVAGDDEAVARFRVRRKELAAESTRILVDVVRASPVTSAVAGAPPGVLSQVLALHPLAARQRIDVALPVAELFVRQGDDVANSTRGPVVMRPFPNRANGYEFGVVGIASREKNVTLGLYALDRPFKELPREEYVTWIERNQSLAEFKIDLAGDGQPSFPASEEPPPAAPGDGDSDKAEGAPAGEAKEDAAAEEPPPANLKPMRHGLLAVIRDAETERVTVREMQFSVQRPRRFVKPHVSFDAASGRIKVRVMARNRDLLPEGKPIQVSCRLADPFPGGTRGKLQGQIGAPGFEANLFINVSSPPPTVVRLYVDVDDFPRAFIFDVPCGKHVSDVPEATDEMEVRLAAASKEGFRGATDSIPVAVEVDAPVGTFETGADTIQLGIDLDQTGAPDPLRSATLRSDRSVEVGFVKATPTGSVELLPKVGDFEIGLPSRRLENVSVNVATRAVVNGQPRPVPTIPLFIDTAPPIVGPVRTLGTVGFVPVNSKLQLSALAWDGGSGVVRVEVVVDKDGTGEFPKEGKPFGGTRRSARNWILEVPIGEQTGSQTLLVRGVDHVGNASEPVQVPIEVISMQETAARIAQQTVELAGSVIFRDDLVPQAEVKLIAVPEGEPAAPAEEQAVVVKTQPNGTYSIPGVAPGNYRLATKGIIRNRVRRIEQELVVAPGPPRTVHLDVALP